MLTAPFPSRALAGGYDLDPDLAPPDDPRVWGTLAGLHVLRHLDRLAQSLRLEIALPMDSNDYVGGEITRDYPDDVVARELSRYRLVEDGMLSIELSNNPRLLPVLGMNAGCMPDWHFEHDSLDDPLAGVLVPGRLFAFTGKRIKMAPVPKGGHQFRLHLAAWQPDFPTHSLVSWGNHAELRAAPMELEADLRRGALDLFTGQ